MTSKKFAMKLGKEIRRVTGLKLPVAQGIAKQFMRCDYRLAEKYPDNIKVEHYRAEDDLDDNWGYVVYGPKGEGVLGEMRLEMWEGFQK